MLRYLHYDVFTRVPLLGNQLAVFTDARGLDTARMQALACEMHFSESTFVLPPESAGTDVRMRIFTPATEMPMAGHPTIGSAFALAHTGLIAPGTRRMVFGLNIGPVPVDLEWDGNGLRFAWMTQLAPVFGPPIAERAAVAATLGLQADALADGLPVQQISCGAPFLFVPLRDRDAVDRAVSDGAAFRRLSALTGLDLGIYLFAFQGAGAPETIYSRLFAPSLGVTEDPATGSAAGPVGCYLLDHGLVPAAAAQRIVIRQGVAMGRASTVHVSITGAPGAVSSVRVGGEAVLVAQGEMVIEQEAGGRR